MFIHTWENSYIHTRENPYTNVSTPWAGENFYKYMYTEGKKV